MSRMAGTGAAPLPAEAHRRGEVWLARGVRVVGDANVPYDVLLRQGAEAARERAQRWPGSSGRIQPSDGNEGSASSSVVTNLHLPGQYDDASSTLSASRGRTTPGIGGILELGGTSSWTRCRAPVFAGRRCAGRARRLRSALERN